MAIPILNDLTVDGKLNLKGSTSGTLTVKAPATASGTLTLPAGTTDLSSTGGTSQVLKQTSAGAPITVAQVTDADLSISDITTNDVSTSKHGFTPKAPNDTKKFLDGTGSWATNLTGGADEFAYWQDQAALLDPAAYELHVASIDGPGWTSTVPAGQTWYLLNSFCVNINGGPDTYFQRLLDVRVALPLFAGTTLSFSSLSSGAYAYICKPALVTGGASYANPKALYYTRMATLKTLSTTLISATVPAGSAAGTVATTAFPTDFTNGMILGYSIHELAWAGLEVPGVLTLNMNFEISDDHQVRIGRGLLCPFSRVTFPNFKTRGANTIGVLPPIDDRIISYGRIPFVTGTGTWQTITLDRGITITRVVVAAQSAGSGMTTAPVIRVGDNVSNNVDVTLGNGISFADSGAVSVPLAAASTLITRTQTASVGGTAPTNLDIWIQYKLTAATDVTLQGYAQALYVKLPVGW